MADKSVEKPTAEVRRQDRKLERQNNREYRQKERELPKDVRQDRRSSERYNAKRERQAEKTDKAIAESDLELNKIKEGRVGREIMKNLSMFPMGGRVNVNNSTIKTQASTVPTAGMKLSSAVANNPDATLTDLNKVNNAAKAVNDAQDEQDAAIANNAIEANNGIENETNNEVNQIGGAINQQEVDNTENEALGASGGTTSSGGATTSVNTEPVPGDGSTALNQMQGGGATFDQGLDKEKIQKQVTDNALKGLSDSPDLAIEKLGVQDYFPNAGQNIAVGSYSGKYLGNATIFAAPGARIPFGLYDARLRALKDAAAEKQKTIDKILTAPQTAAQNQEQYNNEYFFPKTNEFLEKHGGDFAAMMADPEYRQFMANAEAKARDTTQVATWAKTMADSFQKKEVYIPKAMMDDIEKILYGSPEEYGAYLRGENNSYGRALNNAKPYLNVMPQVEDLMKTVTAPDRLTERPFNFKTGGKYDDPAFIAERNKFMERVMNGDPSLGADVYASGVIKYFDVADIEQSIAAMIAGQDGSQEQLPYLLDYAAGMIPKESIKFSYETIRTDELGWAQHYQHIKEWNKEQQDKEMSFARTLDGSAGDMVHPKTDKTFNQEISALAKSGLTGTARQKKLEEIYGVYMGSMNGSTTRVDKNGTIVSTVPLPDIKAVQGDPQKRTYTVTYKDLDGNQVKRNLTAAEIAKVAPNVKLYIGGKAIENNSDFATIMEKPVALEQRKAFYDSNNKLQYLTGDNVDEYDKAPAGRKITFETERLQTYITKTGEDAEGNTYQYYEPISGQVDGNVYNISNPSGQQLVDDRVGYTAPGAAKAQGGGQTTVSSGSTRPL